MFGSHSCHLTSTTNTSTSISLHRHALSLRLNLKGALCQWNLARETRKAEDPEFKTGEEKSFRIRVRELCESRGGCPGLLVPNSPYGLRGCKATLKKKKKKKLRKVV